MAESEIAAAEQLAAADALRARISAAADRRRLAWSLLALGATLTGYVASFFAVTPDNGRTGATILLLLLLVPTSLLIRGWRSRSGVVPRTPTRWSIIAATSVLAPFVLTEIPLIAGLPVPFWVLAAVALVPFVLFAVRAATLFARSRHDPRRTAEPRPPLSRPIRRLGVIIAIALAAIGAVPAGPSSLVLGVLLMLGFIVVLIGHDRTWGLPAAGSAWGVGHWLGFAVLVVGVDLLVVLRDWPAEPVRIVVALLLAAPLLALSVLGERHG